MRWGDGTSVVPVPATGDGSRPSIRAAKLAPAIGRGRPVSGDLRALLQPRAGRLVLLHAPAGYRKTCALAATQERGWLWYNLDLGDRCPLTFGRRLCSVLGLEPLPPDMAAAGEPVAAELATRLRGRSLTITADRYEHVGSAPELGILLQALLERVPRLALRLATRVKPELPLDQLQGQGRLVDVGPCELRLDRDEIEQLLAEALAEEPEPAQVDFADTVLCGWPAAVQVWLAGGGTDLDPVESVGAGRPLRDYLEEEVFPALASAVGGEGSRDLDWLHGPGALSDRVTTPAEEELADRLVVDRVGVVRTPEGWRLHPLVSAVVGMRSPAPRSQEGERPARVAHETPEAPEAEPEPPPARLGITAFGRLVVTVNGIAIDESALPHAPRRLLELLLSVPGCRMTSEQAAGILWPRHLRRSALNAFNVALHVLRRVLEPDLERGAASRYLRREARTFRLCTEHVLCDVLEFRRLIALVPPDLDDAGAALLEEAVALYRGDLLASLDDEFVREPRAALREQVVSALERLGAWHAAGGRWSAALAAYERLLELQPRREDAWAHALECHLEAGDRGRALAAVRRCERALQAAGVEPSGLLRELRHRVLAQAV